MILRSSSKQISKEIQEKLDIFFADLKTNGVSYIGHGIINHQGDHTGYFSNEKWGEFYIQNQFFFHEPILENYEKKTLDLISWKTMKQPNSIIQARTQFTNIISGITLCKSDGDFNSFFNVGFDQDIDLVAYTFFKRDLLLAYFNIFNNYHLSWRKAKTI